MQARALVQTGDPEAIDVFLSREEAKEALAGCLRDEPDWRSLLRIEAIELATGHRQTRRRSWRPIASAVSPTTIESSAPQSRSGR